MKSVNKKYVYLRRAVNEAEAAQAAGKIDADTLHDLLTELLDLLEGTEAQAIAFINSHTPLKAVSEQIKREKLIEREVAFQLKIEKLIDEDKLEEARAMLLAK